MTTTQSDALMYAVSPTASCGLLEALASHADPAVRSAVAGNPATAVDILEMLSVDANPSVRAACVPRLVGVDSPLAAGLVSDSSSAVRAALAAETNDVKTLACLRNDPDPTVRSAVAANTATPVEDVRAMAGDTDASVVAAAAGAAASHLVKVSVSPTENGWVTPPLHDNAVDVTAALSGDVDGLIELATWRACPAGVLSMLAVWPVEFVRATVAAHPSCIDADMDKLCTDMDESVRAAAVCGRPNRAVTAWANELSRTEPSLLVLRTSAEHCSDPSTLHSMAAHSDISVRAAVAGNPATGTATLGDLVSDTESTVAVSVALNPRFTVSASDAAGLSEAVAVAFAARNDLDADVVVALANFDSTAVRRQVAVTHIDVPARLDPMPVPEVISSGLGSWADRVFDLADVSDSDKDRLREVLDMVSSNFTGTVSELAMVVSACK